MMPNDLQSNTEVKMMLEWNRESDWKLIMGEKSYGGGSLVHVPLFNDEKKGQCWWVLAVDGDAMQCVWGWCPLEKGTDQQERKLVVAAMVSHMWWRRLCGEDGFFFPFNFFFFLGFVDNGVELSLYFVFGWSIKGYGVKLGMNQIIVC